MKRSTGQKYRKCNQNTKKNMSRECNESKLFGKFSYYLIKLKTKLIILFFCTKLKLYFHLFNLKANLIPLICCTKWFSKPDLYRLILL